MQNPISSSDNDPSNTVPAYQSPTTLKDQKKIRLLQSAPPILPEKIMMSPISISLTSRKTKNKVKREPSTTTSPVVTSAPTISSETTQSDSEELVAQPVTTPHKSKSSRAQTTSSSSSTSSSTSSTTSSRTDPIRSSKSPTLETELEKHGFNLKDKIFTEKNGKVFARFIKAVNICGQICYIELDTDGYVGIHAQDFHLVESSSPSLIPVKFKTAIYDRIMKDEFFNKCICGIVFESQTGICSCLRHGSGMIETNFLYPNSDASTIPVSIVAFPCIRMSEVYRPNELDMMHRSISETSVRLRNVNHTSAQNSLASLLGDLDSFRNQYVGFLKRQEEIFSKLFVSSRELEGYYSEYDNVSTIRDEHKFSQLLFNLRRRYQMLSEIFTLCQNISNFTNVIQEETRELVDLNFYLDKEFKGIDSILSEQDY